MKKIILLIALLVTLAFIVTACGSSTGGNNNNQSNNQSGQGQTASGQGQGNNHPISPQLQLAVGTFKLEGTPQAVNATEAAQLIPLWQLYGQLETSSSSAPQEVTAAFDQIKSTMTADQINAINAMNLTNQDAFTFMQQQGIVQAGGFGFNGTPQANRTPRAGGGGFPGGNFRGPGGGGPAGGQNLNPSEIATAQARRAQGGGARSRIPQALLDALIKMLQSKVPGSMTSTPAVTSTDTPSAISTDTPAAILATTPTP